MKRSIIASLCLIGIMFFNQGYSDSISVFNNTGVEITVFAYNKDDALHFISIASVTILDQKKEKITNGKIKSNETYQVCIFIPKESCQDTFSLDGKLGANFTTADV